MLKIFPKNKLRYKKGQMAAFFVVILVILLVMALITVNLGKVSLIKTDTSNAADSGALAGGSTMANVFNQQAVTNSQLQTNYDYFDKGEIVLTALAVILGATATISCASQVCPPFVTCCPSPKCFSDAKSIQSLIDSIELAFEGYMVTQYFNYMKMKEGANEGRSTAMKLAYRFAFYNSGIGGKLISGKAPADLAEIHGDEFNYAARFNEFVSDKTKGKSAPPAHLDYTWTDGQERKHLVRVKVTTDGVGKYELRYTKFNTATLGYFLLDASFARIDLAAACGECPCSAAEVGAMAAAIGIDLGLFVGGLEEGGIGEFSWNHPFIRVHDIVHDRLFRVETWQVHQGKNYGLWETKYPKAWNPELESAGTLDQNANSDKRITSFGVVTFKGYGNIDTFDPSFDADLIETDGGKKQ